METNVIIGDCLMIVGCICMVAMIIVVNRMMHIGKMILSKLRDQVYCSEEINTHMKHVDEDVYTIKMMRANK